MSLGNQSCIAQRCVLGCIPENYLEILEQLIKFERFPMFVVSDVVALMIIWRLRR